MKKIIGFILLSLMVITANGQWNAQTSGTNRELSEVYFSNQDTGYVVGINTILKTENGGSTWQHSFSGSFLSEGIYFSTPNNGFAVGYDLSSSQSTIIKTTDAGASWTLNNLTTTSFLNDIYFVNATTGFIVGGDGTAFKTTDGGNTWNPMTTGATTTLQAVYFTDNQNGIIVGGAPGTALMLKTTDGGNTWNTVSSPAVDFLRGVFFPSTSVGYVVGWNGEILKTTDGGNTWTSQTPVTVFGNLDVFFVDDLTGYIVGGQPSGVGIQKTTNGGLSWTSQSTAINERLIGVFFPTTEVGYSVGSNGTILKRTNNFPVGLADHDPSINISTFPNPFVNEIAVSVSNGANKQLQLSIKDLSGRIAFQTANYTNKQSIDLSGLSSGVYILTVEVDNKKTTRKLIKG